MTAADDVAGRLHAVDARAWAQLLRGLRAVGTLPAPVAEALGRPTSELSSGPSRRALCEALSESDEVLAALRSDDALPASIHAAIESSTEQPDAGRVHDDPSSPSRDDPRSAVRARELRRTLDEERRRREGADARAARAEAQVQTLTGEQAELKGRIAELEADIARAQEAVEQAAARAERRSEARREALERDLAAERSVNSELRRDQERSRGELRALRDELDTLRARGDGAAAVDDRSTRPGERPLTLPADLDASTTEAARWLAARASTLLVDGYNAALTLRPGRPLEEQRRWLVERLRPLAVRGAVRPVVIFDGDGAIGTLRDTGGVEVRFTVGGTIADDEIVFAVAATEDPVLVVTDDVELTQRVRAEGGNVVGVIHLPGIVEG